MSFPYRRYAELTHLMVTLGMGWKPSYEAGRGGTTSRSRPGPDHHLLYGRKWRQSTHVSFPYRRYAELTHLMVTLGMGWKPSSEAGRAGDLVQK